MNDQSAPVLDDRVELGLRLMAGADVDPHLMAYSRLVDALRAARRYVEYYELDVRTLITEGQRRPFPKA